MRMFIYKHIDKIYNKYKKHLEFSMYFLELKFFKQIYYHTTHTANKIKLYCYPQHILQNLCLIGTQILAPNEGFHTL
jgi:hypothetical protein